MWGGVLLGLILLFICALPIIVTVKKRRLNAAWERVATRRGAVFNPARGYGHFEQLVIATPLRGRVEGVPVEVRTRGGRAQAVRTMWSAAFRHGGPRFRIAKRGLITFPGRQDVVLGSNQRFDDRFAVECDQPVAVRALWSVEAQETMLARFAHNEIVSDGSKVGLFCDGISYDESLLDAGLDLVEALTELDYAGQTALEQLSPTRIDGGLPSTVVTTPVRVRVATDVVEDALHSVAQLLDPPAVAPMVVEFDQRGVPKSPAGLPPAALDGAKVGPGHLSVTESTAQFIWPTVIRDSEVLRAGARLVGALAVVQDGVFR